MVLVVTQTREVDAFSKIVPQNDIIHLALPLARTLRYAAALRGVPGRPIWAVFTVCPRQGGFRPTGAATASASGPGPALWPPDKVDYTCGTSPAAVLSLGSQLPKKHSAAPQMGCLVPGTSRARAHGRGPGAAPASPGGSPQAARSGKAGVRALET